MLSDLFHTHYFISCDQDSLLSASLSYVKGKAGISFSDSTKELKSLVGKILQGEELWSSKESMDMVAPITVVFSPHHEEMMVGLCPWVA